MCGLAALAQPGRKFDPAVLNRIDTALFHRGPDSGGAVSETGCALIFRRLAIMDPEPASDQPMSDQNGQITLIFNGEIYNFQALRVELESNGVQFRTKGDSEVVLNGYRHWGEELFDRLEGMYAICILDRRRGLLLAARDPLGIKPLYAARKGDLNAFASEVKALTPLVGTRADSAALPELLTFGWAAGNISNYQGIERVPGGTLITVDLQTGDRRDRRFADPLDTLNRARTATEEDAHEAVIASLNAHLMSDVGYSLQLSGGVDSSLIAALAAEAAGTQLDSYAVKLDDPSLDEGEYRKPVVDRYRLNHMECDLDGQTFADMLPAAATAMEGPVPHGGCVALFGLCREIQKKHKVVLTGEGADEMFGGYLRYGIWSKLARQEMIDRAWPSFLPLPDVWPLKGVKRLRGRDYAAYAAMYENLNAMAQLFPDLLPAPPGAREAASSRFDDFRDRLFAVDQTAYLESLLVRQDKMSMAHSVEARVPFVHAPLLNIVNALPHEIRVPGGKTKPVLKRLAEKHLPHNLIHRRKVGLLLPYGRWAADSEGLGRYLADLTDPNGRLRTYADAKKLDKAVADFRAGSTGALPRIFALINMEIWLRSIG
jgi:asparagine synthase (glutamine-hydrolysing)